MAVDGSLLPTPDDEFWLFGYGSLIWKPPPHFDKRIPGWVTGYVRRFWQARYHEHLPYVAPMWPELLGIFHMTPTGLRGFGQEQAEDHRGTPAAPGRVVTLIERSYWEELTDHHDTAPDKVWGVAYRIKADKVAEVKEYLDIREINGYTIHYTPFHAAALHATSKSPADPQQERDDASPIRTLVYIGTPDNEQFVGPQEPQALAEHIYRSVGPSGLNRDYLWGLERALNELSPESGDAHVSDLSGRARAIAAASRQEGGAPAAVAGEAGEGLGQPSSSSPPVDVSAEDQQRQQQQQQHEFRKVSSIDEQEETEKTS